MEKEDICAESCEGLTSMTLGLGWRLSEVDMLGQGGTGAQYKPVVHVLLWLWCTGHSVAVAVQCCMQVGVD